MFFASDTPLSKKNLFIRCSTEEIKGCLADNKLGLGLQSQKSVNQDMKSESPFCTSPKEVWA